MTTGERVALAMRRKTLRQSDIATALGVSQNIVSRLITGRIPGNKHIPKLAEILEVPAEWLTVGDNPPEWASDARVPGPSGAMQTPALDVEGQVSAGTGDIDQWADVGGHLRFGTKWAAVRVKGDSAYPVVYPDQYGLNYSMRIIALLAAFAVSWAADMDALAEQRHKEAVARQAAADARKPEPAPAAVPARWVVPNGTAAKFVPAWAQGDWMREGGSWVIGAKTVGINGQAPVPVRSVVDGGTWCCVELDLSTGLGRLRFVVRRDGDALVMGSVDPVPNVADGVESWGPLKSR